MLIPATKIPLSTSATDLRKSYQTLSTLVQEKFAENPLSGAMFIFYNRSGDRLKILYWHINGLCLWQKRLEKGCFKFPNFAKGCNKITVTSYQLQGLMQGLDCWQVKEDKPLNYQHF